MKATLAIIGIMTILVSGCSKKNDCKNGNCDKTVIINNELYGKTPTDNYMITEATINGDCLEIKFGSSGCDSKSWVVELVDAELITDSMIPTRSIKLALTNKELCAAVFGKTVSFDLKPLQVKGSHKINLNLAGLNETITYSY